MRTRDASPHQRWRGLLDGHASRCRFEADASARPVRVQAPAPALFSIQRQHSDLFGAGGWRFLAELHLRPELRRRLDTVLRLVDDFDREIAAPTGEIDARAKDDPRVDVLRQIRGIGRYIGLLIVAEIGDIERFPTARHLRAWAGMTPTVRSSDAKARLGHISGMGSTALRWALVEAAQKNSQSGGPLRDSFERIAKRRHKSDLCHGEAGVRGGPCPGAR